MTSTYVPLTRLTIRSHFTIIDESAVSEIGTLTHSKRPSLKIVEDSHAMFSGDNRRL
jgi:hypothetical protein